MQAALRILVVLCLLMDTSQLAWGLGKVSSVPFVRVAVLKDVEAVHLSIQGPYKVINPQTQELLLRGRNLRPVQVTARPEGLQMSQRFFPLKRLRFLPRRAVLAQVHGKFKKYRGAIDVVVNAQGTLTLVNVVDLERYVKGVLYHEVSHRWPMEALKAQAVAARTYALYQMQVNQDQLYDVTSDIYSQVYGGKNAERYRTNIAVNRTKREVLMVADQVLPAYFHSNCGGHTENVAELWRHDLAPLAGVVCRFCLQAPNYRWKKNFQLKVIQEALNRKGYQIGLIKEIVVVSRNASGRIRSLRIHLRDGTHVEISGKDFRQLIGPNNLKSNRYEVHMQGYFFDVMGHGWGHGVGMCQWGAHQMAQERYRYQEILNHYYPGATLEKRYGKSLRPIE